MKQYMQTSLFFSEAQISQAGYERLWDLGFVVFGQLVSIAVPSICGTRLLSGHFHRASQN
jgi:hypothetical protein